MLQIEIEWDEGIEYIPLDASDLSQVKEITYSYQDIENSKYEYIISNSVLKKQEIKPP